jgi:hypothetical protein
MADYLTTAILWNHPRGSGSPGELHCQSATRIERQLWGGQIKKMKFGFRPTPVGQNAELFA